MVSLFQSVWRTLGIIGIAEKEEEDIWDLGASRKKNILIELLQVAFNNPTGSLLKIVKVSAKTNIEGRYTLMMGQT